MTGSIVIASESTVKSPQFIHGHEEVFPAELVARFPYVVEKLDALWKRPTETRVYFQELLVTQRENRQGFPMNVYMEIFALSELYNELHPLPKSSTDDFWTWVK